MAILTLSSVPGTGPFAHHLACGSCHSSWVEWGDGFYGNYSVDDTYYLNMCYMDFLLIFTNIIFVYLFDVLGLSCSVWDL